MAEINISVMNALMLHHNVLPETELVLDAYGTLERAGIYFDNRLRNQPWRIATVQERKSALAEATELIDRLAFAGLKTDDTQFHQFPRNGEISVPSNVEKATYEIALKLLDGFDPDLEIDNLASVSQGYSSVRSTYNRTFALEHIRAGIPSSKAWEYLKPYLADPNILHIRRVD